MTPKSNNTTDVLHEDPEDAENEDELNRLLSYLSGRMNTQLEESAVQLSEGQYDAAKAAIGNDYSDALAKYVDVEGEVDEGGVSEQYQTAQNTQREYVETVQEFRETRQEYHEAKQAGDDARARELARRLTRLAEEGDAQSTRLTSSLATVSNETGNNFSEASARIESVQANISEQRDEISALEFVNTTLTVRSSSQDISFSNPLVLSGTLETENGTPVDLSTARFKVGEQTIQTTVDSNGSFSLTYRPTQIPANASNLTVRYRPQNASLYRTTSQTLPVSVTQVDATAQVSVSDESAYGYADTVNVTGSVLVDGMPVENVSLLASLDDANLSAATTDESGRMAFVGSVPASTSVGEVTLRIAPEHTDRAIRVTPATETVRITSEQTVVNATARMEDQETIVVEGTLSTQEGDSVATQPLQVRVGGTTVDTTMTGVSGSYRTTVELPDGADTANTTVTVAFDGDGTNLESASTTASIQQSGAGDSNDDMLLDRLPFGMRDILWAIGGSSIVGLVAIVILRRRTETTESEVITPEQPTATDDQEADSEPASIATGVLSSATTALEAGAPNDAVVVAYTGVRRSLATSADIDESATHWEFYEHCVAADIADAESLKELTAGYEKARYSGRSVSDTEAAALVETAESLIDE